VFERDRSLRVRITVVAAAVAAVICLCVGTLVIVGVRDRANGTDRQRTRETAQRVMALIKDDRLPVVLARDGSEATQVLDAHKRVASSTVQLIGLPAMATFRPDGALPDYLTLCPPRGLHGCMSVFALDVYQPDGIWIVYVANPVIPWFGDPTVMVSLIATSLLIITMMGVGAYQAVGRTLAPVDAIRTELAEITATGLDRRVPVPRNQPEIRLLAETVNDTLDRLDFAYRQLRQFTSDASHDLRSPITAMRTQVEEALMYPDDTDWPRTANAVLIGTERLQALVTDLLTIAQLDGGAPPALERTELAELVGRELDRRSRRVMVIRRLREGVFADCDRLKIARLVTNLIDNAERHADSQMTITVCAEGSRAILEVSDDGAGIAPELRDVVFERFTRLADSRARDPQGTGLGLAIARQIAQQHHGTLTIEDSVRGARFVLRLEQSGPADPS
jgi:signal transduction histidine kinase